MNQTCTPDNTHSIIIIIIIDITHSHKIKINCPSKLIVLPVYRGGYRQS